VINDTVIPDDTDKEEDPDYFDDNHGEDYEDYDYSDDNDYGDYDSVDPDFDEWLDGFALDAGCGAGVSGCETLHAPDCVGRTYIFSPGIVADLDVHGREPHTAGGAPLPSSRVLHPLDSRHIRTSVSGDTVEDRSGGPASVVEATRCPYGAPAGETCVTAHAAATLDVSVEQCRAACDRTEHCVAFTHHVASAEAAELGFPSQCTLLGGVSGRVPFCSSNPSGRGTNVSNAGSPAAVASTPHTFR
jgi:hypothetical protein